MPHCAFAAVLIVTDAVPPRRTDFVRAVTLTERALASTDGSGVGRGRAVGAGRSVGPDEAPRTPSRGLAWDDPHPATTRAIATTRTLRTGMLLRDVWPRPALQGRRAHRNERERTP